MMEPDSSLQGNARRRLERAAVIACGISRRYLRGFGGCSWRLAALNLVEVESQL